MRNKVFAWSIVFFGALGAQALDVSRVPVQELHCVSSADPSGKAWVISLGLLARPNSTLSSAGMTFSRSATKDLGADGFPKSVFVSTRDGAKKEVSLEEGSQFVVEGVKYGVCKVVITNVVQSMEQANGRLGEFKPGVLAPGSFHNSGPLRTNKRQYEELMPPAGGQQGAGTGSGADGAKGSQ